MGALTSHHKRIATGLTLAVFLIAALWYGGWAVFGFAAAACGLGLWEFYSMFWPGRKRIIRKAAGIAMGLFILLAGKLYGHAGAGIALLGAFWAVNVGFLIFFSRHADTPENVDYRRPLIVLAGLIYMPIALQFVFHFSTVEILLVLLASVATDTGAYYTGCTLGGPKIWPSVSPKKTWAGSFGGMTATVLATVAIGWFFGAGDAPARLATFACLGVALNIAAQLGDFFESALKRSVAVKDSGSLLPGHGGILDRIDSFLFVLPVYAAARALLPLFG